MITTEIMGGLGNQLFQIFCLISYSLDNDMNFYFQDKEITAGHRKIKYWDDYLVKLKNYICSPKPIYGELREKNFTFSNMPPIQDKTKNYNIRGYFQSYKYFNKNYNKILEITGALDNLDKYKDLYDYGNIISMHFRLGDYKTKQNFHPLVPTDYYVNSLKFIKSYTEKDTWKILCFYEDEDKETIDVMINEMREIHNIELEFIFMDNSKYKDWEQVLIMSLCHHNIIANSSYSWWGGYFNSNKDKIVCYPTVWFGSIANHDTKDLCPDEWEEIFW